MKASTIINSVSEQFPDYARIKISGDRPDRIGYQWTSPDRQDVIKIFLEHTDPQLVTLLRGTSDVAAGRPVPHQIPLQTVVRTPLGSILLDVDVVPELIVQTLTAPKSSGS